MPKWVKDEAKWEKAKKIAAKEGHSKDYDYITGIYKKMGGKIEGKSVFDMIQLRCNSTYKKSKKKE